MSYYDIDAILTDAQKVPCTTELDLPLLGHLDNSPSQPLKKSTTLHLPLWLAERLAVSQLSATKSVVTLDIPPSLSPRVMNALKASPTSVDLRALAQHFYGLGERILELFEEEEICDVLLETLRVRAGMIGDHAANTGRGGAGAGTDGVEFLRGLDERERVLFRVAHEGAKGVRVWMGDVKKK